MANETKLETLANALDKAVSKAASAEARIESLRTELLIHLAARIEKEAEVAAVGAVVMASRLVDDYIALRPALESAGMIKSAGDFANALASSAPRFIENSMEQVLLAKANVARRREDAASGIHRHN